jgi:transcriptional regulator with XRE-family HTH domain
MISHRMSRRAVPHLRALLAARVRRLRAARGLNRAALAQKSGLHASFVAAVERGTQSISLDSLYRLAEALDVPPESLIAGAGAVSDGGSEGRQALA